MFWQRIKRFFGVKEPVSSVILRHRQHMAERVFLDSVSLEELGKSLEDETRIPASEVFRPEKDVN